MSPSGSSSETDHAPTAGSTDAAERTGLGVRPPGWFWGVAGMALLWNLLGVMAFIGQISMTAEQMSELPPEQRQLYEDMPSWATAAFGIAVGAGALGSIGLLMRRKWAVPLFILSLLGVVIQDAYFFLIARAWEVVGAEAWVMTGLVAVIAISLIVFARQSAQHRWLR